MNYLKLARLITARTGTDGAGIQLFQLDINNKALADPFIHIDEICLKNSFAPLPGFPPHPHRGSQFLTYVRRGKLVHKDSLGGHGTLVSGDCQYLHAGKGVVHSEMPESVDGSLNIFQLWINLPARAKILSPTYLDIKSADIPATTVNTSQLRLLAGSSPLNHWPATSKVEDVSTELTVIDCATPANNELSLPCKPEHKLLLYVYQGCLSLQGSTVSQQQGAILTQGELLKITALEDCRYLVLSGLAINEPVVCSGPFVMNDQQGIMEAFSDYNQGAYGSID
jgi:redox-sensitive bicupin YhaK (pirin superfamily)